MLAVSTAVLHYVHGAVETRCCHGCNSTMCLANKEKSMCPAGIYPMSQEGFERLSDAMDKLTLNDASVSVRKESSMALGPGFRCGFLGMLHMDVFMQRLMNEHGSEVLHIYICFCIYHTACTASARATPAQMHETSSPRICATPLWCRLNSSRSGATPLVLDGHPHRATRAKELAVRYFTPRPRPLLC